MSNEGDDCTIPLDQRYSSFLQALSDIHDEEMRDRCHRYWTSLYRYLDRSMANKRALLLEEKRTHEILHRLDIEMVSQQSDIAYQVQDILQRGDQILSEFYLQYQKPISEHSLTSNVNHTIDHLRFEIKDLQITRKTFQIDFDTKRAKYFSTHLTFYHIQQNIHQMTRELKEVQHELTLNLQTIDEENNQLIQRRLDKQNIEYQAIQNQIDHEQKLSLNLKQRNKQFKIHLLDHAMLWKTRKEHEFELKTRNQDLREKIHRMQKQIQIERQLKHELSQSLTNLKNQLKQKENRLSKHDDQQNQYKHRILELEHQRAQSLPHPTLKTLDHIKQTIHHELTHRLKLTLKHQNLKDQIDSLEHLTHEYASLVKDQRQKVLHYERSHDRWIVNIHSNRTRLLQFFTRMNLLQQNLNQTNQFLEHFDQMKFSLRPTVLVIYNQMNLFLQQRREKNEMEIIEGKCSLNLKLSQMKTIFQSNQIILDRIKQNIASINRTHSIFTNRISTIGKEKVRLIQHLDALQDQSRVKEKQILCIRTRFNQIKDSIDWNRQEFRRLTFEKQNIGSFLLQKQRCIVLLHQHIESNKKKPRLNFSPLLKKIRHIRNEVSNELRSIRSLKKHDSPDFQHTITSLRKDLLESKKKSRYFQHQIHRQIFVNKSLQTEKLRIQFEEKASTIIYRLICKTHSNIILHQRFELLMQNILLLLRHRQTSGHDPSKFLHFDHLNDRLKSSIAELRILKTEILLHRQIYLNLKLSLDRSKKTGTRLSDG